MRRLMILKEHQMWTLEICVQSLSLYLQHNVASFYKEMQQKKSKCWVTTWMIVFSHSYSVFFMAAFFTFYTCKSYFLQKIGNRNKQKKEIIHNFCLSKISIFILVFIENLSFLPLSPCSFLPLSLCTHIHLFTDTRKHNIF